MGVPTAKAGPVAIPHSRILEIGCGRAKSPDAFGLDVIALPEVDLVHDLDVMPWPLPSGHFERVIALDVLEHLTDMVGAVKEIHRVLAPGGTALVRMPFAGSVHHLTDPTHRRAATSRTFDYFIEGGSFRKYEYTPVLFRLARFRYIRGYPVSDWLSFVPRQVDKLMIPLLSRMRDTYEHFLTGYYPMHDIEFELVRI
ncbi:MAG: class I SAM-dependent methyltransferase [Myxococcales bacterium]|nr:class I SAM-dependent methyltransferase [Myxococcales bacterium]